MTRAVKARRHGDDFQARVFWLKAASLLDPHAPVVRVGYERGPQGFEDVVVEYDRKKAPSDHKGRPFHVEYVQCKWHVTAGAFGHRDLVNPAFLNSQKSFLQRVQRCHDQEGVNDLRCRFKLLTNWRLRHDDPLVKLVRRESDAIDLRKLFTGTDRSTTGKIRKLWREHLGVTDEGLRPILRVVAIAETSESLQDLRDRLDERFAYVGLKRVPPDQAGFFYDDLIFKLHAQGKADFDREEFVQMCQSEGIMVSRPSGAKPHTIGIRTFLHPIDNLEERCTKMLDLVSCFDGRFIQSGTQWQDNIYLKIREFVLQEAATTDRMRIVLDAHVSIAFAVGSFLNVKCGKHLDIEQRTAGRSFWSADDLPESDDWPKLSAEEELIHLDSDELAVAIGLTHDVSRDVSAYVRRKLRHVGSILHFRPESVQSRQSVRCGRHAVILAETVKERLRTHRQSHGKLRRIHLFISGPNALAFFLGQLHASIGTTALYEWDFEGQRTGTYSPSLVISPDGQARPNASR